MRARPLVVLSAAAVSLLALAGCSASGGDAASPTATASADLCDVAGPSGAASDSVTVTGDPGTAVTAEFTTPIEATEFERTVVQEGTGDPIEAGDWVNYSVTAFDATTGEVGYSASYDDATALPLQVSADAVLGQVLGCATIGSRIVAVFPSTDSTTAEVDVIDVLGVTSTAAWGEPQEPVDGMPEVTLGDDGEPSVTIPDAEAPTEVQISVLKKGDGAVVADGDTTLLQYHGVAWDDGETFDTSWDDGTPYYNQGNQYVAGFVQALEGQTVGSQVLVVIPPEYGYGGTEGHALQNDTLVFVIDILATQHAVAG